MPTKRSKSKKGKAPGKTKPKAKVLGVKTPKYTFPIVHLTWIDSSTSLGWTHLEVPVQQSDLECQSCGYLVRDDELSITISTSWTQHGGEFQWISPVSIPKVAILSLTQVA